MNDLMRWWPSSLDNSFTTSGTESRLESVRHDEAMKIIIKIIDECLCAPLGTLKPQQQKSWCFPLALGRKKRLSKAKLIERRRGEMVRWDEIETRKATPCGTIIQTHHAFCLMIQPSPRRCAMRLIAFWWVIKVWTFNREPAFIRCLNTFNA